MAWKRFEGALTDGSIVRASASSAKAQLMKTETPARSWISARSSASRWINAALVMIETGFEKSRQTSSERRVSAVTDS